MKVEGNSVSVPVKQTDDGGTPLLHFIVRYKQVVSQAVSLQYIIYSSLILSFYHLHLFINQDKEGTEWTKLQLSSETDTVFLRNLAFSSDYHLEITAVNANGSSVPATFNFTTAEQPGACVPLAPPATDGGSDALGRQRDAT